MSEKMRSRGPAPQDEALFSEKQIPVLKKACHDLSGLLSDGYPLKASLKLVGDRYKLRKRQRTALMRSAASDSEARQRFSKRRKKDELRGKSVFIDGFNYLITAEAIRSRAFILGGQDGFLRDLSGIHGTYRRVRQTDEVLTSAFQFLRKAEVADLTWVLDKPVSDSERLRTMILETSERENFPCKVILSSYADKELIRFGQDDTALVITADSAVIDAVNHVFPLSETLLRPDTRLINFRNEAEAAQAPPFLKKGDKAAILAPAGYFPPEKISLAAETVRKAGFEPVLMPTLRLFHDSFYRFAGNDEARLKDLQEAMDNPDIRAVICARGGYGTSRISERLDFSLFRKSPKWLVGFSDITALHARLYREGFASLHALMPSFFDRVGVEPAAEASFEFLKGNFREIQAAAKPENNRGEAEGVLLGGNLSVFLHLLGSKDFPKLKGSILFLEEVGEPLYVIDRLIGQLDRAGAFDQISGLIVGELSEKQEAVRRMMSEGLKDKSFPYCFDFPLGHHAQNMPVAQGMNAYLKVDEEGVNLRFPA